MTSPLQPRNGMISRIVEPLVPELSMVFRVALLKGIGSKEDSEMKFASRFMLLSVALLSCLLVLGASAQAKDDPLGAKVSLTKPYPPAYEGAKTDKISVQYAVTALGKQAGLGYDFKASQTNVGKASRKFITPKIEGISLRKALKNILGPLGLSYEVRDGKIVLIK